MEENKTVEQLGVELKEMQTNNDKIPVKEITEPYKTARVATQKKAIMDKIEVQQYVPYTVKVATIKQVLESACVEEGLFNSNSDKRYCAFTLMIVALYTNMDIAEADSFDELKSSGVYNAVVTLIPQEEVKELQLLWTMLYDDMVQKYASLEAIINKQSTRIGMICSVALDRLAQAVEVLDVEKIAKAVKTHLTR